MNIRIFFRKIFILAICIVVLDFIIGSALAFLYDNVRGGERKVFSIGLEEQTDDLLIFGSSRANRHYIPSILADSLNTSCYNLGRDGEGIFFQLATLDVILERYTPERIILDIRTLDLDPDDGFSSFDKLKYFNPYVKRHPVLWNTFSMIGNEKVEKIKHCSFIYPYNSHLTYVIKGNLIGYEFNTTKGYFPEPYIWNESIETVTFQKQKLDEKKVEAFHLFYSKCKEKNIELIIISSPMFLRYEENSSTMEYVMSFCEEHHIPFARFHNLEEYENNLYFMDYDHLNSTGAQVFTSQVAHWIKNL